MSIGDESHAHEPHAHETHEHETSATAKSYLHPNHQRAQSFLRIRSIRSSRICSFGNEVCRRRSQRHLAFIVIVDYGDVYVVDGVFDLDDGVMSAMECISKT